MSSADLTRMVAKLRSRAVIDDADAAAVLALPFVYRVYEVPAYLVREGEVPRPHCSFLLSGTAIRQKHTGNGGRQILSLHIAGDFIDLQHLFLERADHNVQALTRVEAAEIDRAALQELVLSHPAVARAMWIDALIDASIFREWTVNVGRRDARARITHLLCEFAIRLHAAGLAGSDGYTLPMTQEQIADACGLTSVHVNRTLKALADEGLIHRNKRHVGFSSWERLREAGDFSALYLHLDQNLTQSSPKA